MTRESIIRERISTNLEILEPNLKLVAQEHLISMPDGKKAYIDILAKDDFGCFTVIELKKSNQTARSAIQQLYKYASFLKKKNRLEESQIRCFILSTVWDELEAPFSEFVRFSGYESKGYMIHYENGNVPSFTEIKPVYEKGNRKPLDNFIFFEFSQADERDNVFREFTNTLKHFPSVNSVLIKVDYKGYNPAIIHPFGFAWVMFTGDVERIQNELSKLTPVSKSEDSFDPEDIVYMWELDALEYALRTEILTNYVRIKEGEGEYTGLALHSLNNTLATWKYYTPVSLGVMFDDSLFDSEDLLSMSLGHVGQHPYNFVIKTTPSRPKQFLMVRDNLNAFLSTNNRWRKQVNSILESMDIDDVASIWIYNPLNFFGIINDVHKTGSSQRIPQLYINIKKTDNSIVSYYGALFWRAKMKPAKPEDAIEKSYTSMELFKMRSVMHRMTEYDDLLSKQYGLSYEIISVSYEEKKFVEIDEITGFKEEFESIYNLQDFLKSNDLLIDEVGMLF